MISIRFKASADDRISDATTDASYSAAAAYISQDWKNKRQLDVTE